MGLLLRWSPSFILALFVLPVWARADTASTSPIAPSIQQALGRDDAAAAKALAAADLAGAMRYFDYVGHEQKDFGRATLEYRLARQKLGVAVRETLGRRAWGRAARLLGVPRHGRGPGELERSVRREGAVLFVQNTGA